MTDRKFKWAEVQKFLNKESLPYFQIVFISATILSLISAYLFASNGLQIAHFDSKGHLMVARRIFDNLNPGFRQIGAFWLPLPHLFYLPFVQNDFLYFHGLAALPVSLICFVSAVLVLFKLIEKIFDRFSAFCCSALYFTNPNMLYLQTTPLTENLALLFMLGSIYMFVLYATQQSRKHLIACSLVSVPGILSRYENWFVFAAMGLLLLILNLTQKRGIKNLLIDGLILAVPNAVAIGSSFWLNWYTTGHAYMSHAFKHTDFQPARGSLFVAFFVVLYTIGRLVSYEWVLLAVVTFVIVFRKRFREPGFVASLAILAPLLLYLYEYRDNHPTRIRYGIPFVPATVFFLAYWPSRSKLITYLFLTYSVYTLVAGPFHNVDSTSLMIESMRDAENLAIQQDLLWYLRKNDDGTPILATMAELAPTLYDLQLPIKRYVHEGAKPYWNDANAHPEQVVGWVFLSQDDRLWKRFHDDPEFHKHFALVGRRSFLELYRRTPDETLNQQSHKPHPWIDRYGAPNLPDI